MSGSLFLTVTAACSMSLVLMTRYPQIESSSSMSPAVRRSFSTSRMLGPCSCVSVNHAKLGQSHNCQTGELYPLLRIPTRPKKSPRGAAEPSTRKKCCRILLHERDGQFIALTLCPTVRSSLYVQLLTAIAQRPREKNCYSVGLQSRRPVLIPPIP
jgi:hypothetical protein